MNITFLIGNGFDLELGLKTRYRNFVDKYSAMPCDDEDIGKFRKDIKADLQAWSYAELEMGKYTVNYSNSTIDVLRKCYDDFLFCLSNYLDEEEKRYRVFERTDELSVRIKNGLSGFGKNLPEMSKSLIGKTILSQEAFVYNIMNFNYTSTFDLGFNVLKKNNIVISSHSRGGREYRHYVGDICHIHGVIGNNMIMGVDNTEQIANKELQANRKLIRSYVKPKTNSSLRIGNDTRAERMIKGSCIICIYGMSLGETDASWWKLIMECLKSDPNKQLVVFTFENDYNQIIPGSYLDIEDNIEDILFSFSDYTEQEKNESRNRIHVRVNSNLFGGELKLID